MTFYVTSYYNNGRRYFGLSLNTHSLNNRIFLIPLTAESAFFRSAVIRLYTDSVTIISKYTLLFILIVSPFTDARYVNTLFFILRPNRRFIY